MKTFYCDHCGQLLFFENVQCLQCGHALGFLPDALELSALSPGGEDSWRPLSLSAQGRGYRSCRNSREHQVCNWMVPADDDNPLCLGCRLNHTIPDLTAEGNRERWFRMEQAKRRALYTLLRLKLPLAGSRGENRPALQFSFLADPPGGPPVLTGHCHGLLSLNIAEADDAEREKRRVNLHEPYRTLLGHFRHELGHFYWEMLIAGTGRLEKFRQLFGDESCDYARALKAYYEQGPPADWQARHLSAYASAHPWEDWAETWAHYQHIVDTIEMAASFGMSLAPRHPAAQVMTAEAKRLSETDSDFDRIFKTWLPLTYALNSLNRGMGFPDLYPFVLSAPATEKLRFIHEVVQDVRASVS